MIAQRQIFEFGFTTKPPSIPIAMPMRTSKSVAVSHPQRSAPASRAGSVWLSNCSFLKTKLHGCSSQCKKRFSCRPGEIGLSILNAPPADLSSSSRFAADSIVHAASCRGSAEESAAGHFAVQNAPQPCASRRAMRRMIAPPTTSPSIRATIRQLFSVLYC